MNHEFPKHLVTLVADKNMEFAMRGLLSRHGALGIHALTSDVFVHPERDPGCYLRGHDFLRPMQRSYEHGLVLFDREGCGRERDDRNQLERAVEQRLAASGWAARAAAIAIDPELERWLWVDSPHLEVALGWYGRVPELRSWLGIQGLLAQGAEKPDDPKKAVEEALRVAKKPRSSALYLHLAQVVTFDGCRDGAFRKLRETLGAWFGPRPASAGKS